MLGLWILLAALILAVMKVDVEIILALIILAIIVKDIIVLFHYKKK